MVVTIDDVAKRVGYSKTTVSHALNNPPGNRISKETRKKILGMARKMEYTPNPIARALVSQKLGMISLIIPDITNPVFVEIIRGIQKSAIESKYDIVTYDCSRRVENELSYIKLSRIKRLDGIIIAPTQNIKGYNGAIGEIPFVSLAAFKNDVPHDYVISNAEVGAYKATEHLIRLGHKSIALIIRPVDYLLEYRRIDGYLRALKKYGIDHDKSLIKEVSDFDTPAGYKATKDFLTKVKNFTAIVAYNDIIAIGVMEAVLKKGLRIPEDIALIGADDIEFAKYTKIPLTTLAISKYRMGQKAVRLLMDKISGKEVSRQVRKIVLEPKLVIRDSCGEEKQ